VAAIGRPVGARCHAAGGNPLACAVGLEVLDAMTEDGFLDHVSRAAGHMRQGLEGLVARHPDVFELVRGTGLMIGLKCRVPNIDVVNAGYDAQVIVVPGGDNVVRILPPLNISLEEVDEGLKRLERAASALQAPA
ncbi:MAG: aminotransferase class III-fold pyridoxal phosphate-dependent enzyme, partial [Pseudomonadota bacterium]